MEDSSPKAKTSHSLSTDQVPNAFKFLQEPNHSPSEVKVRAQQAGMSDPLQSTDREQQGTAPEKRRPQTGLGEFLVLLLGNFSHKNNDPHKNSRDTPEASSENDCPFDKPP